MREVSGVGVNEGSEKDRGRGEKHKEKVTNNGQKRITRASVGERATGQSSLDSWRRSSVGERTGDSRGSRAAKGTGKRGGGNGTNKWK